MSLGKNRVCLCPCLCVTHEDIKVRQAPCPSYAAVAHGSVPLSLLQGRSCYIKLPLEPLSSLDGLAGGCLSVQISLKNIYSSKKSTDSSLAKPILIQMWIGVKSFSLNCLNSILTEPYIFLRVVVPLKLSGAIPGQSSS